MGPEPAPLSPAASGAPVVIDPLDQTWARLGLDELTAEALPGLLPSMDDPLTRAAVWGAVRDGVSNAEVDPESALVLLEKGLPHEDSDLAIGTLTVFALGTLCDRLHPQPEAALGRFHAAADHLLRGAEPGADIQLAALRAVIASSQDRGRLRAWLDGEDLPDGVSPDLDLRWRILIRLAGLGAVEWTELDDWLAREPTTKAAVDHVQARAALPEPEAKEFAWAHFTGRTAASNYQIEAAGQGMWRRGQESLTRDYVGRYFDELPATAQVRSGWVLADAARAFFPRLAVTDETVARCGALAADLSLEPSLRRALVDSGDDLSRALRARKRYWGS